MIYVPNEERDPRINLAIETYLLQEMPVSEPMLLFYINEPSIIIGRNQNTIEEINQSYVNEHGIHVVRRLSGGGAVYHDLGNLNFSFIMPDDGQSFRDFKKVTEPIIKALHQLGATGAELQGRNDLLINGKKFSGNAMYATNGRMFAHGTLMFDSNLEEVTHALNVRADKIASKGIKSIRSRVTNIKPFLDSDYQTMTTVGFRQALLLQIFGVETVEEINCYQLTAADWQKINEISEKYYQSWDWNYGKSPAFTIEKRHRFPIGSIEAKLEVAEGKIRAVRLYGDFFGQGEIADVETALIGVNYERQALQERFASLDLHHYFGQVTADELATLLSEE